MRFIIPSVAFLDPRTDQHLKCVEYLALGLIPRLSKLGHDICGDGLLEGPELLCTGEDLNATRGI